MKDHLEHDDPLPGIYLGTDTAEPWTTREKAATPTAIIVPDGTVSSGQLTTMAEQIALSLHSIAAQQGPVAILADPGLVPTPAAIGVLLSGRAYLPIAGTYPDERIRYILEDSGAHAVLASSGQASRIAAWDLPGVQIINAEALLRQALRDAPESPLSVRDLLDLRKDPQDPAYLIYTSGSTGHPKGIAVPRAALMNQLEWLASAGYLEDEVRIIQKTPIGFDAAQWEILAPLVGAQVVVAEPGQHRDPYALLRRIQETGSTALQAVPTLLQALVDTGELRSVTSLRRIFSGGEALAWDLAEELQRQLPTVEVINLYGPSECTINASFYPIEPGGAVRMRTPGSTVPIGRPVSNTGFMVVREGSVSPEPASEGELWISGAQVAAGYHGRPEETRMKFTVHEGIRHYRTGDHVRSTPAGDLEFIGRLDNQVKLRGNRVELDEVAAHFQRHPWVARSHALVLNGRNGQGQELVACIQLDPRSAPLMDGSHAAAHHRSKANKRQVRSQLANSGLRQGNAETGTTRAIPKSPDASAIEAAAFRRKSYRFFNGPPSELADVLEMLRDTASGPGPDAPPPEDGWTRRAVLEALHAVSAHRSDARLLPKYLFASPGALNSIQVYLENDGTLDVPDGLHYFHPLNRTLQPLGEPGVEPPRLRFHLVSKTTAISDVYESNVVEVQLLEAGHLLGAIEQIASRHGAHVWFESSNGVPFPLQESETDNYLGTVEFRLARQAWLGATTEYLSASEQSSLPLAPGLHRFDESGLGRPMSDRYVRRTDVIAINQHVYDRSDFGVLIVPRAGSLERDSLAMGFRMHRLQANGLGFGLMSSGYSSFTGCPLPTAATVHDAFGSPGDRLLPYYFALAGRVTEEQLNHRGMDEDSVHMAGPAEMVTQDMAKYVPEYMVPDRTVMVSEFPVTPNGKVDARALAELPEVAGRTRSGPVLAPATATERLLASLWSNLLGTEEISSDDNFFHIGGDSIRVMMLVSRLRSEHGIEAGPEAVFTSPVLGQLASHIDSGASASRLVPLRQGQSDPLTVIWPGLGGVPVNLRSLARLVGTKAAVYGVQASGINPDEPVERDIEQMAASDIELLPEADSYRLVGYSFGCRVAFETAVRLESMGRKVESLVLICPGNPSLGMDIPQGGDRSAHYGNPEFVAMLTSVFTGSVDPGLIARACSTVDGPEGMADFVADHVPGFDRGQISRIIALVAQTYQFDYSFDELARLKASCPVLVIKAEGDLYSSLEEMVAANNLDFTQVALAFDHYEILREPGVRELAGVLTEFQVKHA